MIDYRSVVAENTELLASAVAMVDADAPVPSCPDWTAADLCFHLYEVQSFWSRILEEGLLDPDGVEEPPRPSDGELPDALRRSGRRLLVAFDEAAADREFWTWVGRRKLPWFERRQAHEALIHRVDGELAAGIPSAVDPGLAADGIQELIDNSLTIHQAWARFEPGERIELVRTDGPGRWVLAKGRFHGTSTETGTTYDMVTIAAVDDGPAAVTISGAAAALDLWLWGRGSLDALSIEGDASLAAFLREDLAETLG